MSVFKHRRRYTPPVVSPAGSRADSRGPLGIPVPDRDSIRESFAWVTEHQQ